jgi:hypothetical protein
MTRILALTLLACATDPAPVVDVELRDRLTVVEKRLELAEQRQEDLARQVDDARSLCLIGGPKRRYNAGVRCSDDNFLPGSFGASAHRALMASGFCEDTVLPKQAPMVATK